VRGLQSPASFGQVLILVFRAIEVDGQPDRGCHYLLLHLKLWW